MKYFICVAWLALSSATIPSCQGQSLLKPSSMPGQIVGGGCDGCEVMYVGMPKLINKVDTSAGWTEAGEKLVITGKVYHIDGTTPAPNVVIYYWQTDNNGYYSPNQTLDRRALRHGHIRGWVKTDAAGSYAIYTIKPAAYPNESIPAHIHTSIKEPGIANEYYIDEFVFDDDPLLTAAERKKAERRGGSGVLRLQEHSGIQAAEHDIILGLKIPNYPSTPGKLQESGLSIGEESPSFTPFHVWGPDKGSTACPVCKYGKNYGILYFVGNSPGWREIKKWLNFLELESRQSADKLKVYFVYGNEKNYSAASRKRELEALGKSLDIRYLAITFVPSLGDHESDVYLNNINPKINNTFIIYKNRIIIDTYTDIRPTGQNLKRLFTKIR
ncbi:intradiol ring-cleavage dioxygenase [Dyadobacter sp. CY347]|uniref:dioxygenase family protein n=1 Tax=Dyadobacter sp. CY347 TaxID=2909336 RepID=UPI001F36E958|nr:intradiol ring-cleavage dioxygenase [Dyadobacter sp. CY347]MCF2489037.1 intradiol ring-cleavage dioxygenase [Dyadobacter sp. CY347]